VEWPPEVELLAQLLEMTSILASQQRIKEPVRVPRPESARPRRTVAEVAAQFARPGQVRRG
jgi:hypothetical protein